MISFSSFYKKTGITTTFLKRNIRKKIFIEGRHFIKELKVHNFYWVLLPEGEKKAKELNKQRKGRPYYPKI
jgi:hypothetical protein